MRKGKGKEQIFYPDPRAIHHESSLGQALNISSSSFTLFLLQAQFSPRSNFKVLVQVLMLRPDFVSSQQSES